MSISYLIVNNRYESIGKSGSIRKPFYLYNYYKGDLIDLISKDSSIPKNAITNLYFYGFRFDIFGNLKEGYYLYDDIAYKNNNFIYAMVNNELYSNLFSSISKLNSENNSLRYDYNSIKNTSDYQKGEIERLNQKNSDNESRINYLNQQNSDNQTKISQLSRENQDNKDKITNLSQENQRNKDEINSLNQKNETLNKRLQEEENLRKEEKEKFNKFKIAFEEIKKDIEKKHIEISEKYIYKFIVNKFVKEFETKDGKKNSFTISLIQYMEKFNEEFIFHCHKFLSSFKANSQTIVNEFNVNDNNILIEHINFIVIGKAGVGKSTFINESLHLPIEKRAKEDIGKSVTDKSILYSSDKLKMVRMWDTQWLDYKISQEYILNEVKRIVEDSLKKGPDHYINIILYCTTGERFQDEDGQLIYEIMKLYPSDNLPVIITQLQAYFINRVKKMEKKIRDILSNYLDSKIADKIEIRDIVAREEIGGKEVFKARGIPELLRLSVELMGRAITSATCKKFSEEIENLCKNFVDKK